MRQNICLFLLAALAGNSLVSAARADAFGSGVNAFSIEFVAIGNPGNPPDANPNPAGAVPYMYRIGKYEISEAMIEKSGIGITKDTRGPNYPATNITWYEAARFVNWLNISTGNAPAYNFAGGGFQLWQPSDAGYDSTNLYRNKLAKYFLPSLNEWHKAAYYDPAAGVYHAYPTGTDTVPDGIDFVGDPNFDAVFYDGAANSTPNIFTNVGEFSRYGTGGQGGNVFEWQETAFNRLNDDANESRGILGGSWVTDSNSLISSQTFGGILPAFEQSSLGFRVASIIPEPTAVPLLSASILVIISWSMTNRRNVWNCPRVPPKIRTSR